MAESGAPDAGPERRVTFPEVRAVACGWIADFVFVSLCHYFKEDQHEQFEELLLQQQEFLEASDRLKKVNICCFLARIVHGKKQDVQYEGDERITPLMSALTVWNSLEDVVEDKAVFDNIKKHLFIQSVAVCMEKGDSVKALWIVDWLAEDCMMSPNFKMKLSMIVNKKDIYHKFLTHFSFTSLVENIKAFLDHFLKLHPSDFILKAALKVVQSCQEGGVTMREMSSELDESSERTAPLRADDAEIKAGNEHPEDRAVEANTPTQLIVRAKRSLFSTKNIKPWKPDSTKKPAPLREFSRTQVRSCLTNQPAVVRQSKNSSRKTTKKKWTYEEDQDLKTGVRRYGEGKWARILQEFNFPDRTGVMLKDRWRTLRKQGLVD